MPTAARQWHSGLGFAKVKALTSNILCLSVFDIRWTVVRLLDLVFGEALGQAIKHDKPACRRCKSWHRKVAQWTVDAQNARPPRFWLPGLTFTRTQTARSQARKQTQIWLRCTSGYNVFFESSSWRSLDLEKGHWTITKGSQRLAWNRMVTSFCFAVNVRVQEAKADGRSLC